MHTIWPVSLRTIMCWAQHGYMYRGQWANDPTTLRAAAKHGVIRAQQLVRMGVPEVTVYRRCRHGGPWRRLLPGIIMLSNGRPSDRQLLAAALLHGGPKAMLTGLNACRLHGIRRGPAPSSSQIHLLVPHLRQVRNSGFVKIERTLRLPDPVIRDGVPLAPLPRACLDAARRLSDPREVTELLADAVQRGLCDVAGLRAELDAGGRRGSAVPRAVLTDVGGGVRSAAERDAKLLWQRTGLPEPWWNASVYDDSGQLLGIVDAWWNDVALAWEIDSVEFHLSPSDYARTTERAARFTAAGAVVLPMLPSRVRQAPEAAAAELLSTYRFAAARPRPPLRAQRAAG
jgi:hypothetical protein